MGDERDPLVRNAADKDQVGNAREKEKARRYNELEDLRRVLATLEGRRLLWRIMGKAKVFESIWEPSAKIHYNSGQQDLGHFVMAEIIEANPESYFQMMMENKKEK